MVTPPCQENQIVPRQPAVRSQDIGPRDRASGASFRLAPEVRNLVFQQYIHPIVYDIALHDFQRARCNQPQAVPTSSSTEWRQAFYKCCIFRVQGQRSVSRQPLSWAIWSQSLDEAGEMVCRLRRL
ncbi:hypothetical protein DOTSEDRAFT_75488 [Dothistroma septosporum NZE10]|uniref:Uncharacterized protein n=1 Tax=Dothistroma septosporum (strain NZE10 / CBS 128990) TaxID=675120 RepID=M2XH14_DOTSN|nr:hypothetical protein DOTSEDRAFT_75488 [Dothistroma septosporum NZE10]